MVPADPAEEPTDAPATDAVQTAVTEEVADQQGASPITAPRSTSGAGDEAGRPAGSTGRRSWRVLVSAVALIAVVALLVAPAAVMVLKARRRRRRQTGTPGSRVAGAWAEALDRLTEAGLALPRSVVAEEVAGRAAGLPTVPPAATAPLAGLAALANRARFAPTGPSPDEAAEAWSRAGDVAAGLLAARSRFGRLRLALDPRPLRPAQRSPSGSPPAPPPTLTGHS